MAHNSQKDKIRFKVHTILITWSRVFYILNNCNAVVVFLIHLLGTFDLSFITISKSWSTISDNSLYYAIFLCECISLVANTISLAFPATIVGNDKPDYVQLVMITNSGVLGFPKSCRSVCYARELVIRTIGDSA